MSIAIHLNILHLLSFSLVSISFIRPPYGRVLHIKVSPVSPLFSFPNIYAIITYFMVHATITMIIIRNTFLYFYLVA